jgi:hypothetical protein
MDSTRVEKPDLPQISVRLPDETKAAFTAYVEELELDISQVANLLILREKRLRRLEKLSSKGRSPKRPRQTRGRAIPRQHVTVYFGEISRTLEFQDYAKSCGLKRTDALAWLLEQEVEERWLKRALQTR